MGGHKDSWWFCRPLATFCSVCDGSEEVCHDTDVQGGKLRQVRARSGVNRTACGEQFDLAGHVFMHAIQRGIHRVPRLVAHTFHRSVGKVLWVVIRGGIQGPKSWLKAMDGSLTSPRWAPFGNRFGKKQISTISFASVTNSCFVDTIRFLYQKLQTYVWTPVREAVHKSSKAWSNCCPTKSCLVQTSPQLTPSPSMDQPVSQTLRHMGMSWTRFLKEPFRNAFEKNRFAKLHEGFHLFPNTFAPILFFCVGTRIHRKTAGTGKKGAQKLASACNSQGNRGIGYPRQIGSIICCIILLHRFHQIWKLLKPRWNRIFTKSPKTVLVFTITTKSRLLWVSQVTSHPQKRSQWCQQQQWTWLPWQSLSWHRWGFGHWLCQLSSHTWRLSGGACTHKPHNKKRVPKKSTIYTINPTHNKWRTIMHQNKNHQERKRHIQPTDPATGWLTTQPTLMVILVLNHIHGAEVWIGTPHGRNFRLLMVCEIGAIEVAAIAYLISPRCWRLRQPTARNGCISIYINTHKYTSTHIHTHRHRSRHISKSICFKLYIYRYGYRRKYIHVCIYIAIKHNHTYRY